MRRLILCACALALALATALPQPRAAQPTPVLVELFTSEGCSDCPPADTLLQKLVVAPPAGAAVIALGQHVDYWDRLGWKDRFSSAALTERQQLYAARFNNESIYTPQMVVDGRTEFVGSDASAARKAIDRSAAVPHGSLVLQIADAGASRVTVSVDARDLPPVSKGDRADIIVAVTEDGLQSIVKGGENRGRTLSHAAVVRQMTTAREVAETSASARVDVPLASDWHRDRLKIVGFVQERRGRTILASAEAPLKLAR
jgi:hypothetical protein